MTLKMVSRAFRGIRARVVSFTNTRNDEAHLLSSSANAERLRTALEGARKGEGKRVSMDSLRTQMSLEKR